MRFPRPVSSWAGAPHRRVRRAYRRVQPARYRVGVPPLISRAHLNEPVARAVSTGVTESSRLMPPASRQCLALAPLRGDPKGGLIGSFP